MKNISELREELGKRKDFRIINTSFDGGAGMFTNSPLLGATVIWSYAGGWEHVSMCPKDRTPTWDEMCMLKDMFWKEDEAVMQLHPPKQNYVNNMKHCLHLWKPIEKYSGTIPLPQSIMVGMKKIGELG